MTVFYIDVSHYDWDRNGGNLDWQRIKEDGITTVFIRATYGDPEIYNPTTRYFVEMALAAKDAGLMVGGYHNLIRGDAASIQRQVTYFRDTLDSVGADFAMLDVEPYLALRENGLWPRYEDALAFSQVFSAEDKRRNLAIYLAQWVWSSWLGKPDMRPLLDAAKGPLINANYQNGYQKGPYKELYPGDDGKGWVQYGNVDPEIWQYSSSAYVPGASNVTDVNAFKGSNVELTTRLVKKGASMSAIEDILWPGMKALEPKSQLGGILARKPGYHNSRDHLPSSDYSVSQFAVDRQGPADEGSAIDWTFPDAQAGNYATISKYSKRLYAARSEGDERTYCIREFFGQIDNDSTVEGWDFSKNRASSSDSSHLWHIHISIHRKYINSTAAMRAILSILKGESLEQWRAGGRRTVTYEYFNADLPILKKGDQDPIYKGNQAWYVARVQKALQIADGIYGPDTVAAVKNLKINDGNTVDINVYNRLHALKGTTVTGTRTAAGNKRTITEQLFSSHLPILVYGDVDRTGLYEGGSYYVTRAQRLLKIADDGEYSPATAAAVKKLTGTGDGKVIDLDVWVDLYGMWGAVPTGSKSVKRK